MDSTYKTERNAIHCDACYTINKYLFCYETAKEILTTIPGVSKTSQSGYYFKQA